MMVKLFLLMSKTEISLPKRKKPEIPNINDVVITEDMLKEIAVQDFPVLPDGYEYIPDTMWKPGKFKKD